MRCCARPAADVKQEERDAALPGSDPQIMADSPDIWIYNTIQLHGMNKRVKGCRFCPVGGREVRWITLAS